MGGDILIFGFVMLKKTGENRLRAKALTLGRRHG
jgi:hypothetical protein